MIRTPPAHCNTLLLADCEVLRLSLGISKSSQAVTVSPSWTSHVHAILANYVHPSPCPSWRPCPCWLPLLVILPVIRAQQPAAARAHCSFPGRDDCSLKPEHRQAVLTACRPSGMAGKQSSMLSTFFSLDQLQQAIRFAIMTHAKYLRPSIWIQSVRL